MKQTHSIKQWIKGLVVMTILIGCIFSGINLVEGIDRPDDYEFDINAMLLPENFKVYVNNNSVVNWPAPGFSERILPVVNAYEKSPGCYIAAYSHNKERSIYGVGGDIYVMGMVRVPGKYEARICQPTGFEHKDISAEKYFKVMLNALLDNCEDDCWAGGDTGGFLGAQPR